MTRFWTRDFLIALGLCVLLLAAPLVTRNESVFFLLSLIVIWSIFALAFDFCFGRGGILSFGHAAFFALGAYGYTWATMDLGLGFGAGLAMAILCGAVFAVIVGLVGQRVTGLYFALLTLMLAQLLAIIMVTRLRRFTGGDDGIAGVPRPMFGGIDFFETVNFFWLIAAILLAVVVTMHVLNRSPLGQAIAGLKQNEERARQIGFNTARLRLAVLSISGAYSGLAGALLGALLMYVSPQLLSWKVSGDVLIMALLGGTGTLAGPILGVTLFELLKEVLSSYTEYWYGILGITFILCTIFLPKGVVSLLLGRDKSR
ncbi:branched-chain amino acid ABC transporter permease [Chachezhania sediminis]|uniref:branched-chain amino acid ABC transporter permease n=1 Tax=Chachezhania sediminis TaxID=2599291 RepID=UPI00131D0DD7|nr:branched-chain amino acid ABC transporter permease [Chachezhania sediminis]